MPMFQNLLVHIHQSVWATLTLCRTEMELVVVAVVTTIVLVLHGSLLVAFL